MPLPLVVGRAGFPKTCLDAESMPTTLNMKSWPHNDSIRRNRTMYQVGDHDAIAARKINVVQSKDDRVEGVRVS